LAEVLHEYEYFFRRLSDIVHGSWRALKRYHLRPCLNPLHRGHHVAWTGATHDAGLCIVYFGIMMAVETIAPLLVYMGKAAEPSWSKRLASIKEVFNALAKRDLGHHLL